MIPWPKTKTLHYKGCTHPYLSGEDWYGYTTKALNVEVRVGLVMLTMVDLRMVNFFNVMVWIMVVNLFDMMVGIFMVMFMMVGIFMVMFKMVWIIVVNIYMVVFFNVRFFMVDYFIDMRVHIEESCKAQNFTQYPSIPDSSNRLY